MSQTDPIIPTKAPLTQNQIKRFIMLDDKVICKAILLLLISLIDCFIIYKYKVNWVNVLFDILFAILTVLHFIIPFGMNVCVDPSTRVMSIKKVCILYGIWFCCPKQFVIDDVKEFTYEIRPNGKFKQQLLCVVYKDGREKEIIYISTTSYFCFMHYDAPIEGVHQQLNNLMAAYGGSQQSI